MATKSKVPKIPRSHTDLKAALIEQVGLLQSVCSLYDQGNRDAAKFMAVTLRVLLHETQQSHSLLQTFGLRAGRFCEWPNGVKRASLNTTGNVIGKGWTIQIDGPVGSGLGSLSSAGASSCRLVVQCGGPEGGECVAPLSSFGTETKKRFDHWWNDEVVRDQHGRTYCRRELILDIANTDGGAHVDPGLEQRYLEFSRKNSLGWNFANNGKDWESIPSPHLACMRQIAHEVLVTLQRRAPWANANSYKFGDPIQGKHSMVLGGFAIRGNP